VVGGGRPNGTSPGYLGLAFVSVLVLGPGVLVGFVCFRKLSFPAATAPPLPALPSPSLLTHHSPALLSMHNNCYLQQFADVINIYDCFILSACKYSNVARALGFSKWSGCREKNWAQVVKILNKYYYNF